MEQPITPPTAGATTGNSPAPASTNVVPASDWTSGLQEDMRGYVQNKGFKDPGAVVESYRHLEKMMGAPRERLLTLPEKADAPEWAQVYEKLGRPKDAKEYMLKAPEGVDQANAEWAQNAFHKLGLSRTQGENLFNEWNNFSKAAVEAQAAAQAQKAEAEAQNIKKEWGMAYEQNVSVAKRAASEFGLTPEKVDALESALGYEGTMKLLQSIGSKFSESSFVTPSTKSTGFGNALTPEAAKNRIQALRQDNDFVRRYTNGDMAARTELDNLHVMAYPPA